MHSVGYVASTDETALAEFWGSYQPMRDRIGAELGWQPIGRSQVERGSLHVGSPETVARRIVEAVTSPGACRFDMKYRGGRLPHEKLLSCIKLYGTKVIPWVREMTMHADFG